MSFWTGTHWEPENAAPPSRAHPSRLRHTMEALAEGSLLALLVIGLIAGTAFAGKASGVWIEELAGSRAAGLPYGSPFTVGYSTSAREPWAHAVCYPNASTVLDGRPRSDGSIWGAWFSVYPGGPTPQGFVLGESVTPAWVGGGADCVVQLVKLSGRYNGSEGFSKVTVLARTTFAALP